MVAAPDFDLWAGDKKVLRIPLVDEDGDPVDASDASASTFDLIHGAGTLSKTQGSGCVVSSGDLVVTLDAADSSAFGAQVGAYQATVTKAAGLKTVVAGEVNILVLTIPP